MLASRIQSAENWIFDWSGTLVDDLNIVLHATNHVFENYGRERIERDDFKKHFRLPYDSFYAEHIPGVPIGELEGHFREGFANAEEAGVDTPLLPCAYELLVHLKSKGKRIFILSSMDKDAIVRHARELGVDHFFEEIYAGIMDKREHIHVMIERHELVKEETVFLGDMCHDIETARHGGIASIALLTGYQSREQLSASNPDFTLEGLHEVHRHLEAAD